MRERLTSVLVFAIMVLNVGSTGKTADVLPYEDQDAYDVFSVLLPTEGELWSRSRVILILQGTEPETGPIQKSECFQADDEFRTAYADLLADYDAKNSHAWLLEKRLQIEKPYHFVPRSRLYRISPEKYLQQLQKQFPESFGYLRVSAVGFNKGRTLAMAYMAHDCGNVCGAGETHFLEKRDGVWIQFHPKGLKMACGWIS